MPEVVVYGATGFTGRLVAHALSELGVRPVLSGRNPARLEALANELGGAEMRPAGDAAALARALEGADAVVACAGPFTEVGDIAVEAALRARVNYLDSTGEQGFVARLLQRDAAARAAGVAMAPAMGFDEIPADVAATLAAAGLGRCSLTITYAAASSPSRGTLRSALRILPTEGVRIVGGETAPLVAGDALRWAPMPPPLGPKRAVTFPFAISRLAPRHLELESFETYMVAPAGLAAAAPLLGTAARRLLSPQPVLQAADALAGLLLRSEGPGGQARRAPFTVLAEACSGRGRRAVAVIGSDVYGLTARLLAACAVRMASADYDRTGVLAPVEAVGLEFLQDQLAAAGVRVEVHATADKEATWHPG